MRPILLVCGIMAAVCYVAADIAGAILYAGYHFTDQAVSGLFAIGAPTNRIVVPLFTLSNLLLAAFAPGERVGQYAYALWQSALAIVLLRERRNRHG
ncbi:MAG: hypothetical protein ACT4UP_07595 [Gammaproteobacteria bacterium]